MAAHGCPAAAREEAEAIAEAGEDLAGAERPEPGGSELYRQREALEAPADLDDCRGVGFVECEARLGSPRPIKEERHGVESDDVVHFRDHVRRNGERRHAKRCLAVDVEGFAARRQDCQALALSEEGLSPRGGVVDQVLAVVEQQ